MEKKGGWTFSIELRSITREGTKKALRGRETVSHAPQHQQHRLCLSSTAAVKNSEGRVVKQTDCEAEQ